LAEATSSSPGNIGSMSNGKSMRVLSRLQAVAR